MNRSNMEEDVVVSKGILAKTADWIKVPEENGEEHYQCSNCGMTWFLAFGDPIQNEMNYCPRCGLKMEKVVSQEE